MFISSLPLADIIQNLEDAGNLTGWNTQQFFSQCVAVIVLFTVLNLFAWKPVRAKLEERRHRIEEAMANADKIKSELADTEAARIKVLQKANEQANEIIAEAQKSANVVAERRAAEASAQAADILHRAHEASVLDRDRLFAELKQKVGDLVIQTTAKVTGKVLTSEDQTRLQAETVQQINASNN